MLKVKTDSRKVVPGDIFVAMIGQQLDGHDFIEEAIDRGAKKIVVCKPVAYDIAIEVVKDTKEYLQTYLESTYRDQLQDLKIIGITGTNGKTTTTSFIYQILLGLGIPTAYIGTLGYITLEETIALSNTTPDIVTIYELLIKAKQDRKQVVVMDVSSHA